MPLMHDTHISAASISDHHPLHPMMVPFPIAAFVGTFITDVVYWRTGEIMWERFSVWLLAFGLATALLAALAGLIDFLRRGQTRTIGSAWFHAGGNIVVLAMALLNVFVHSRDAYTAVVPWGVVLSGIVVVLVLFTGWMGWEVVNRQRVEILK